MSDNSRESLIKSDVFARHMKESLNKAMLDAAEPIIQESMRRIETEMRRSLGANIISFLESTYNVEMYGQDIRIMVKGFERGGQS